MESNKEYSLLVVFKKDEEKKVIEPIVVEITKTITDGPVQIQYFKNEKLKGLQYKDLLWADITNWDCDNSKSLFFPSEFVTDFKCVNLEDKDSEYILHVVDSKFVAWYMGQRRLPFYAACSELATKIFKYSFTIHKIMRHSRGIVAYQTFAKKLDHSLVDQNEIYDMLGPDVFTDRAGMINEMLGTPKKEEEEPEGPNTGTNRSRRIWPSFLRKNGNK